VNPIKVFERDGWRCGVCGKKTPKRWRGTTKDNAPELDHRISMGIGGGHTYENCQCACRKCNREKGHLIAVGQLPLISNPASLTIH
jgi:5-methylcytosine-specific restriction endonuclease McrA